MLQSFDSLRNEMEKVYEDVVFDPQSGISPEEMEEAFQKHCIQNPSEPYILTHAWLMNEICCKARISPEPDHIFAGLFEDGQIFRRLFLDRGKEIWNREFHGEGMLGRCDLEKGIGYMVDVSHIAPDWKSVLTLGLPGLLERVEQSEDSDFARAGQLVCRGAIQLARRLGKASDNQALLAVAERKPETLQEAFQLTYFFHELLESGMAIIRSMGRFDRDFYPFYQHDLAAGILTRESAKELLKHYWMRFYAKHQGKMYGKNFCFGPEINELSYIGIEAYREMKVVDPKLSIFLKKDTPEEFLRLYVSAIREGETGIVTLNYDMITASMLKAGRDPEDVADVLPIGCYEPAIMGKEVSSSGATHFYFPCVLLQTIKKHDTFSCFDDFLQAFLDDLTRTAEEMAYKQSRCEKIWPEINPVPLLSITFADCVKSGKDITSGGAKYNTTGCVASYIADCVDSLAAIREIVFRRKLCSFSELKQILASNWEGYRKLNWIAKTQCPKWGNNDPEADDLALQVIRHTARVLGNLPNGRGGRFSPSIYGQRVVEQGREIGALPSGRYAGEPMSKNMDAVIGMDRNGVTALMESVLKIDMTDWPSGTCLDLMLHPTSVRGEAGLQGMISLIRTFISMGGSGLQFNIFDADTLRDAQKNPEKYENLQVRVCGWNVRFNDLSREAQETFIRQADELV